MRFGLGSGLGAGQSSGGLTIVRDGLVMQHNYNSSTVQPVSDGAAYFDATGDYIDCGTDASLRTSTFTVVAWAKFTNNAITGDDPGTNCGIISSANSSTDVGFSITKPKTNKIEFRIGNGTGLDNSHSTTVTTADRWYHVAMTYDGVYLKAYVDGVLEDYDKYTTCVVATGHFGIGKYYAHTTTLLADGYIANVGYWSEALTQSQIKSIMWKPYSNLIATEKASLVSWWALDEGTGTTANDSHGSNNGSATGF